MIASPLEDIEAAALQLATADRARLAERLLASLAEDNAILAAWQEETERRADAFERGEIGTVDVDEAVAQTRVRIASHRPTPGSASKQLRLA